MAKSKPTIRKIQGENSWRIANKSVEAFLTQRAGHLGPVTFKLGGKKIAPLSVAWDKPVKERSLPPILQVLRGDFFCMPFGGNSTAFGKEKYPVHGETANSVWKFADLKESRGDAQLTVELQTKIRRGTVTKTILLKKDHPAIYQRHVISKMSGEMNLGHHAMVKFPDVPGCGAISTSPFVYGQVFVEPIEHPEELGYTCLKPGATITTLKEVPTVFGEMTDLSRYPARRGYEDLVMLVSDDSREFAWTAVAFPQHGYCWFALKDPKVLRETIFWISNGGRHMSPWSSRHINVIGLEEVTSYFHPGLAQSVNDNHIKQMGYPTTLTLDPKSPTTVNYIMALAPISKQFDEVAQIEATGDGVTLISKSGEKTSVKLDVDFLKGK